MQPCDVAPFVKLYWTWMRKELITFCICFTLKLGRYVNLLSLGDYKLVNKIIGVLNVMKCPSEWYFQKHVHFSVHMHGVALVS